MISALLTTSQKSPRKHERHFKQNTLKIIDICDNKYVVVTGMSLSFESGWLLSQWKETLGGQDQI